MSYSEVVIGRAPEVFVRPVMDGRRTAATEDRLYRPRSSETAAGDGGADVGAGPGLITRTRLLNEALMPCGIPVKSPAQGKRLSCAVIRGVRGQDAPQRHRIWDGSSGVYATLTVGALRCSLD